MSKIYQGAVELIGNTPLVEVTNLEKKQELKARVLVKLEYLNPAGSVKDRIAKAMLEDAEQKLQECAGDEAKMVETTALISRIRNAYEIRETGVLLNDAERRLTELEQSLKTQEKQLPILEETRKTAEKAEEQKKLIRDQELQSYSKIAEKESIDFLSASDAAQPSEIDREHLSEQGHKELARNILKWFDI